MSDRLMNANQTKADLIAEIVAHYPEGRGGWARFYRSWTKDALRAQLTKVREVHQLRQRAADATGIAQLDDGCCYRPAYDTREAVRAVSRFHFHCRRCGSFHPTIDPSIGGS